MRQEDRARAGGHGEVRSASDSQRNEHQGNCDEGGGVLHHVATGLALPIGLVRLNKQSSASKLGSPEERDREKVRHLPQEQDGEQDQRGSVDASRDRGPSDERRDGSGN